MSAPTEAVQPLPRVVGMVHLAALPGAPDYGGDMNRIIADAVGDATVLADAGCGGVMVENFGDAPFYADDVPKITVAAMTAVVRAVTDAVDIPVGVNVLRNDALAALAVAAAAGASMIRVNVLSGMMYTDQGPIVGRAAEVARIRAQWCPQVRVLADVMVKHATPPPGLTLEQAAADLAERGGADAIVVSGTGTGKLTRRDDVQRAKTAGPLPVLIGSGVTPENVGDLLESADGVIVGTSIKLGGVTTNPVDPTRAAALVAAATPPGP